MNNDFHVEVIVYNPSCPSNTVDQSARFAPST